MSIKRSYGCFVNLGLVVELGCGRSCIQDWDIIFVHVTEKERIPTIPVSTVPFLRDPNFVERSEYRQLAEKLSLGRTRVALTGFGGAGCV